MGVQKTIFTPEQEQLRALIREARREAELTQADMALLLGWPQAILSNIERGERRVDVLELRQICWAAGVPLDEFVRRLEGRLQVLEGPAETRQAERAELMGELVRLKAGQAEAHGRLEARRQELRNNRRSP